MNIQVAQENIQVAQENMIVKFALTVQDARIALMAVHVVYVNDTLEFCYKKNRPVN